MGTFNYGSSDYITLAFPGYYLSDFDGSKEEIIDEMIEYNGYADREEAEADYDDYVYNLISSYEEDDYYNAEDVLDKYSFYYFHVVLKSGYYSGSQLDIETNFGVAFDNYEDKREAQKEITQIKKCLHELNGIGMKATWCGWCPTWFNYDETEKMIDKAIEEMREEVRNTPTWKQYDRETA